MTRRKRLKHAVPPPKLDRRRQRSREAHIDRERSKAFCALAGERVAAPFWWKAPRRDGAARKWRGHWWVFHADFQGAFRHADGRPWGGWAIDVA